MGRVSPIVWWLLVSTPVASFARSLRVMQNDWSPVQSLPSDPESVSSQGGGQSLLGGDPNTWTPSFPQEVAQPIILGNHSTPTWDSASSQTPEELMLGSQGNPDPASQVPESPVPASNATQPVDGSPASSSGEVLPPDSNSSVPVDPASNSSDTASSTNSSDAEAFTNSSEVPDVPVDVVANTSMPTGSPTLSWTDPPTTAPTPEPTFAWRTTTSPTGSPRERPSWNSNNDWDHDDMFNSDPEPYEPPTDDPIQEENDDLPSDWTNDPLKQLETTADAMIKDRNVRIAVIVLSVVAVCFMLCIAQQMLENPDGCCASLCRCSVACVRLVCCCCCRRSKRPHHHRISDYEYTHDLELS